MTADRWREKCWLSLHHDAMCMLASRPQNWYVRSSNCISLTTALVECLWSSSKMIQGRTSDARGERVLSKAVKINHALQFVALLHGVIATETMNMWSSATLTWAALQGIKLAGTSCVMLWETFGTRWCCLLTFWCQVAQHTFRCLVGSKQWWIRAVLAPEGETTLF